MDADAVKSEAPAPVANGSAAAEATGKQAIPETAKAVAVATPSVEVKSGAANGSEVKAEVLRLVRLVNNFLSIIFCLAFDFFLRSIFASAIFSVLASIFFSRQVVTVVPEAKAVVTKAKADKPKAMK
jgi:hypothetical protein